LGLDGCTKKIDNPLIDQNMITLRRRLIRSLCWLAAIAFLFGACVDNPIDPDKGKKKAEMNIEVSLEGDVRIFNDCSYLQAFIYDLDPTQGYNHALMIRGITDEGDKGATTIVYFNQPQDLQSGIVTAFDDDGLTSKPWFYGQVMTQISSPGNFLAYSSLFLDKEYNLNKDARLTFTKFDQTNGIISGNFSFKAQSFTPSGPGTRIAQVTGTFTDIVLFPSLEAANQCYGGPDLPNTPNPGTGNSNPGAGSSTKTTANFKNNTFTPVTLNINSQSYTVGVGSTVNIQGSPASQSTFSAETNGKTSSGTQVGLKMTWNGSVTFPASGSYTTNLDVPGKYFFLRGQNNSGQPMTKLYVNYGLVAQTLDNITIANNGQLYSLGYYEAYSNSNVRAENGNNYWSWNTLNLSGATNQSVSVTGN